MFLLLLFSLFFSSLRKCPDISFPPDHVQSKSNKVILIIITIIIIIIIIIIINNNNNNNNFIC